MAIYDNLRQSSKFVRHLATLAAFYDNSVAVFT